MYSQSILLLPFLTLQLLWMVTASTSFTFVPSYRPSTFVVSKPTSLMTTPTRTTSTRTTSTTRTTTSTVLFLENDIADMIDRELYRQQHKREFESTWMKQNREAILHSYHRHSMPHIEDDIDMKDKNSHMSFSSSSTSSSLYEMSLLSGHGDDEDRISMRQYQKDCIMAQKHPERYCSDRCLATGNCDVLQDFFDLSPEQVLEFCTDCVLSDGQEPCDIPPSFWNNDKEKEEKNNNKKNFKSSSSSTLKP